jgi:hypothetical protein
MIFVQPSISWASSIDAILIHSIQSASLSWALNCLEHSLHCWQWEGWNEPEADAMKEQDKPKRLLIIRIFAGDSGEVCVSSPYIAFSLACLLTTPPRLCRFVAETDAWILTLHGLKPNLGVRYRGGHIDEAYC